MTTLVCNPRTVLALGRTGQLEAHVSGAVLQLDARTVAILMAATVPRSRRTILQHVVDDLGPFSDGLAGASAFVDLLQQHSLLVPPGEDFWISQGWWEAAVYHDAAQSAFFDDFRADGTDVRGDIIADYTASGTLAPPREDSSTWSPSAELVGGSLIQILDQRRTTRTLGGVPVPAETCRSVLALASTRLRTAQAERRNGSAQAPAVLDSLFRCMELRIIAIDVDGLPPGSYRFDATAAELRTVRTMDRLSAEAALQAAVVGQRMAKGTAFAVFVVADFEQYMRLYRHERAYRNLLISAGELGNLLVLSAGFHRLRQWLTPALADSQVDAALDLPNADTQTLYAVGMGP